MRKLAYTLLALILTAGVGFLVFGNGGLLPDTAEFSRLPKNPGTIGYVLNLLCPNFISGCRVSDSEKLGGINADQYIKAKNCVEAGTKVWKGIDQDGNPICGEKTAQLAWSAKITELGGNITIFSSAGQRAVTSASLPHLVQPGDIIQTNSTSTGTITFSDESVLRIDTDTTVELSTSSNSAGDSIAAIILADGQLWGRVLTSSGMDFGAGGYIAGVRGTSILVSKPKNNPTVTIAIIDSMNAGNTEQTAAASIKNTNPGANTTPLYVNAGSKIIEQSGATTAPTQETGITKASLLTESTWIRKNALEDLDYLANKLEDNATNTRVKNEIISATPTEETEIRALIPGAYPELDADLSRNKDGIIGNDPVRQAGNISKTFECAGMVPSKRFWSSLSEQISPSYCQEPTLFAYADYTKAKATGTSKANSANNQNYVPYMYTPSSSVITFINELKDQDEVGPKGYEIDKTNEYISYTDTNLIGSLGGKTISIELDKLQGTTTIAGAILESSICQIYWKRVSGSYQWSSSDNSNCTIITGSSPQKMVVKFLKTPEANSTLYIGNNHDGTYPINAYIKSITIN